MTTKTKGVFLLFKGKKKKIAPYNNDKYKNTVKKHHNQNIIFQQ